MFSLKVKYTFSQRKESLLAIFILTNIIPYTPSSLFKAITSLTIGHLYFFFSYLLATTSQLKLNGI